MMEKISVVIDEDLMDLIPGFLENRDKDIIAMREAIEKNDYESIRIIGHSMKGFGSGYGFDYISEVGYEIEKSAKAQISNEIESQIKSLEDYLKCIVISYK